jgi:hypothetical protein
MLLKNGAMEEAAWTRQSLLARSLRISGACKPAASKATMCFAINRYANYIPIPKADKEYVPSRIRGADDHRPLLGVPTITCGINKMEPFPRTPCGDSGAGHPLRAKPRCVLKSTDAKITVPSPRPSPCRSSMACHVAFGSRRSNARKGFGAIAASDPSPVSTSRDTLSPWGPLGEGGDPAVAGERGEGS